MQGLSDGFGQHEEPISSYEMEQLQANLAECREVLAAYVKRDEDNKQALTLSMQRGWALENENEYLHKKAAENDYLRGMLAQRETDLARVNADLAEVTKKCDRYLRTGKDFLFIINLDLKAMRRVARAATHPDLAKTDSERKTRKEKFQRAEAVFDRIERGG